MVRPAPELPGINRKHLVFSLALISLLGLMVYANSLTGQFLWDDETLVQYNPYIKSWAHLGTIWTTRLGSTAKEAGAFYRPVQTISYLLDYSFWRLNVLGYHIVNVMWHIVAAWGVFGLMVMLFKNVRLALMTALLFVAHPVHTEAVSYISGRADSMAAAFLMLSWILYLKYVASPRPTTLVLLGLSFLLAMLSKEIGFALPFAIIFSHLALKTRVNYKGLAALIAALIAYGLWRFLFIGSGAISEGPVPNFMERLPGVFVAITNYVKVLIWPFGLHMEYGGLLFRVQDPKAVMGILLVIVCLGIMVFSKKRDPFVFFGLGWFWIWLLPSLNLFYPINAYMAEHWLYLSSVGFFLIIAKTCAAWWEDGGRRAWAMGLMVVLVAFYGVLTVRQNRHWQNGINFYQHMLRYAPGSSRLHNNLAKAFHDTGKNDELIELLTSAIRLEPDNALAHNNLGNAYKGVGRYKEAVKAYEQAIRIDPAHAGPYYNLSTIYADIDGNLERAVELLTKALTLSPDFSKAYNKLGLIYQQQGKSQEALALLDKAMRLNPDDPQVYHNLGYIFIQRGDNEQAKAMYEQAKRVEPNYAPAYHDLAVIYFSEKNYALAVQYCDKSVALGYEDPALLEAVRPYR